MRRAKVCHNVPLAAMSGCNKEKRTEFRRCIKILHPALLPGQMASQSARERYMSYDYHTYNLIIIAFFMMMIIAIKTIDWVQR